VESKVGPLGTAANTGLLYLPRIILRMEKLVEWMVLAGETEVLGDNLLWRHFIHHKSHLPDQGANPGRRGGKPATNRLSYGAGWQWSWLRHYATRRKVAVSNSDEVDFIQLHNPSSSPTALGSTQPLTETSWRIKGGRCVRLTTYRHLWVDCVE
jgi:hypothetical protein